MKKLTILTSLLALTACGGGSGGVAPNDIQTNLQNLDIPASRISSTVAESNKAVTSMDSSITNVSEMTAAVENVIGSDALNAIASNSETISNLINRSATSRNADLRSSNWGNSAKAKGSYIFLEGGQKFKNWSQDKKRDFFAKQPDIVKYWGKVFCGCNTNSLSWDQIFAIFDNNTNQNNWNNFYEQNHYREYTLENVDFTMAAASGGHGDEGGSKDIVKFKLDPSGNGEIDAVIHEAWVVSENGTLVKSEDETAIFTRNGDTNTFHVVQTNGEGNTFEGDGYFLTYGDDVKLKHSDFGRMKYDLITTHPDGTRDPNPEVSYESFAGGYKYLRKDAPETSMNFAGIAVGSVSSGNVDTNISGRAELSFDSGTETLNMYFSQPADLGEGDTPWYDMTIVRSNSGNSVTFTTNDELNETINPQIRFNDFGESTTRTPNNFHLVDGYNGVGYETGNSGKIWGDGYAKLEVGYYGIDETTEATGVMQYVEQSDGGEIRMDAGFGMVKVQE